MNIISISGHVNLEADIDNDRYPVPNHPDLLNWVTLSDGSRYAAIGDRTLWDFPEPDVWRVQVALTERDGTIVATYDTVDEAVTAIYADEVRAARLPAKVERVRASLVRLEVPHRIDIRPVSRGRFIYLETGRDYVRAYASWRQSDGSLGSRRTTRWVGGREFWAHKAEADHFTQRLALFHLRQIARIGL